MSGRTRRLLPLGLLSIFVVAGIARPLDDPRPAPTVAQESTGLDAVEARLAALEEENAALRSELAGLRADREAPVLQETALLERYPVPAEVTLCGERVPLERPDVHQRFEEEWARYLVNQHWFLKWSRRARDIFPYVEARMEAEGMPADLVYVLVIESGLESRAYSSAGAAGWWQFINSTGKRYGLRRDKVVDERRDLGRATDAAIAYFRELHEEFGSWPLALSAYNAGERRVRDEIEAQGEADFYDLSLPRETEAYWFKAAAIKVLFENPGRYGFRAPDAPVATVVCDTIQLKVKQTQLPLREVASAVGLSYREFRELNPAFRRTWVPRGTWRMVLPHERVDALVGSVEGIELAERRSALSSVRSASLEPVDPAGSGDAVSASPEPRN